MNAHDINFYPEKQEQQLPEFYLNPLGQWFGYIQHHTRAFYAFLQRNISFREVIPLQLCCS